MEDKTIAMARSVASAVQRAGGRTFYVGGCVRDALLGLASKDIDIEVHGISVECLSSILDSLGERMTIGASFGVMGLRHYNLDIAMPRSEAATGRGHRDFSVLVDPFLGCEKAARRRDFTINALMQDVLTGEVLDFFGGRADLDQRVLRHVDARTFVEDPLRVFRAAQFAARFGLSIAEETSALCAGMDVTALPGERVMGELEKALQKARTPSVFFVQLRRMSQLAVWFRELDALIGLPQDPRFHPEGDVWTHTLQVLDEAARMRERAVSPLWLLLSALCHDLGKARASADAGRGRHAAESVILAREFLHRLTSEAKLGRYVLNMVQLHMQPNALARGAARQGAYMRLFDRAVCPEDLLLLARADALGRCGPGAQREALRESYAPTGQRLEEMLRAYRARMAQPYVMGRDLVEAGVSPGPRFREALDYAHKLRLAGRPKQEQLRHTLAYLRKEERERGNES